MLKGFGGGLSGAGSRVRGEGGGRAGALAGVRCPPAGEAGPPRVKAFGCRRRKVRTAHLSAHIYIMPCKYAI
eukprot:367290-Pyramimonas_sp.AAC.1